MSYENLYLASPHDQLKAEHADEEEREKEKYIRELEAEIEYHQNEIEKLKKKIENV